MTRRTRVWAYTFYPIYAVHGDVDARRDSDVFYLASESLFFCYDRFCMKEIVAVLPNIRSLHNVGSAFRTADAAGVSKLYLSGITPKPVDPLGNYRREIVKVALGAERTVPWECARSTVALLKKLKKTGYQIFAVEQSKRSIPYYRVKPAKNARVALVVGNEVEGLPADVLRLADKILEIPMRGKKESLNVSVAFGIVLFGLVYNK